MSTESYSRETLFTYRYEDGTDRHLLPADEGSWSLEGIAHAATLATHFLVEGKVRHRAPYSDKFRIYIAPPTAGSWETQFVLALASPEAWAGAIVGGAIGIPTLAFKLLRRIGNRATGVTPKNDETKAIEERHQGSFDALVEAAEPSLIRAHRVITSDRTTLDFSAGSFKFSFNKETKTYIETNVVDDQPSAAVGNVASFNVNRRTGRIFIDNLGRSVPFLVHKDADHGTSIALARSLENYASTRLANSDLRLRFRATRAPDGSVKRVVIYSAQFLFGIHRP
ncbi:hypothetical protein [Caulobacter segnis]|uniref:DUF7946 domain-containing protein n=1 Tax=Caulobacter segnis TaxID=88688 RepID=UPI00285DD1E4|nr:hypothetical protein [Caulobacter segnis]MDR6624856.1 hypothetical protein [Caulobacter segnis]